MRVVATDASLVALVQRQGGSEYRWLNALQEDPICRLFARYDAVSLGWHHDCGRRVLTTRPLSRGELVMSVPATAHVAFAAVATDRPIDACLRDQFGLDAPTLALSLAALQTENGLTLVRALSAARDDSAAEELVASRLRSSRALPPSLAALPDAELGRLVLRVKSNLHVSHDDQTASRAIGVGLYPAAAMLNHSCAPSVCFSWSGDGSTMHIRAMVDVASGEELTCSYLTDEQLYAPWDDRRELLASAFQFAPSEPSERKQAEAKAGMRGGERVRAVLIERTQSAIAAARRAVGAEEDDAESAERATERLVSLIETELRGSVPPFHTLVQEAHVALLALARSKLIDEPSLVAKAALHLITAREALLPIGTPHLASLYATHGAALTRVMREGSMTLSQEERAEVAKTAVRSLTASHAIRTSCLGEAHPLSAATAATVQHARQTLL